MLMTFLPFLSPPRNLIGCSRTRSSVLCLPTSPSVVPRLAIGRSGFLLADVIYSRRGGSERWKKEKERQTIHQRRINIIISSACVVCVCVCFTPCVFLRCYIESLIRKTINRRGPFSLMPPGVTSSTSLDLLANTFFIYWRKQVN